MHFRIFFVLSGVKVSNPQGLIYAQTLVEYPPHPQRNIFRENVPHVNSSGLIVSSFTPLKWGGNAHVPVTAADHREGLKPQSHSSGLLSSKLENKKVKEQI